MEMTSLEEQGRIAWKATVASAVLQLPTATQHWNGIWLSIQEAIKARGKKE